MGGNQFQPSQDFCRSKRVVSLFPLCVSPATTCLSAHDAASLTGCELVESSAVGTAGQKSLPPCQECRPGHAAENNAFDSL